MHRLFLLCELRKVSKKNRIESTVDNVQLAVNLSVSLSVAVKAYKAV